MRKIELQLREAIQNFKPFSKDNTVFHPMSGTEHGWELVLHGNTIAIFDEGDSNPTVPKEISLAGWPTPTTCSRLNALDGVTIQIKKGVPYLNGTEIESNGWYHLYPKYDI